MYLILLQHRKLQQKDPVWKVAELKISHLPSFSQVVDAQGNKHLSFEELYPYIDDSDNDYTVEDLLAALNQAAFLFPT